MNPLRSGGAQESTVGKGTDRYGQELGKFYLKDTMSTTT